MEKYAEFWFEANKNCFVTRKDKVIFEIVYEMREVTCTHFVIT